MKSDSPSQLAPVPRHVAIVMDGNGRWASQRGLPRLMGHREGVQALVRSVRGLAARGVEFLTVYAFSTENWARPQTEVSGLMALVPAAMRSYLDLLGREGVRVRTVGDLTMLSPKVRQAFLHMEESTAGNRRLTLNVAFNYGGRWDMVQACRRAMEDGVAPQSLDERVLGRYMALSDTPDPDLLIRTGGECRLSNFLLWQLAYAEMFFTERLWPEFDVEDIDQALAYYASRERRFGSLPGHHAPGVPEAAGAGGGPQGPSAHG